MCGIVGLLSNYPVVRGLLKALKKLEYRGYDSAGMGLLHPKTQDICCIKTTMEVEHIGNELDKNPSLYESSTGIGHTRWATHGKPSIINAHPQHTSLVAVAHNGIIENHVELRSYLEKEGLRFQSQTDTEVVPMLFTLYLNNGLTIEESVFETTAKLEGKFALLMLFAEHPDLLVAVKKGSPLAIGSSSNLMIAASDAYTLSIFTDNITYLEDGDIAFITSEKISIYNDRRSVEREQTKIHSKIVHTDKNGFPHFMLKEMHDVPDAVTKTLEQVSETRGHFSLPSLNSSNFNEIDVVIIVACGSSYFAGYIAKQWLESITGIITILENSSEFRDKKRIRDRSSQKELFICISQSGETADTTASLEHAKKNGMKTIGIVNNPESTITRMADQIIYTKAGLEMSVASTKTFASQVVLLYSLMLVLASAKNCIFDTNAAIECLKNIGKDSSKVLAMHELLDPVVEILGNEPNVLYIGRGIFYGVAMEGALKLKEIAYIHAESILTGELKHGSLALVDEKLPIMALLPMDHLLRKNLSNIEEIASRGGKIIAITDSYKSASKLEQLCKLVIVLPVPYNHLSPVIYSLFLQLLAYKIAVSKGLNVDKPRNLAKSVTVE